MHTQIEKQEAKERTKEEMQKLEGKQNVHKLGVNRMNEYSKTKQHKK